MMAARVKVVLDLTSAQASALAQIADAWRTPNPAVASDRAATESWGRLADALHDARREAAMSDADIAKRTHTCPDCGRALVYSARGNRLAPAHDCPHGKRCYSRHGCAECRAERIAKPVGRATSGGESRRLADVPSSTATAEKHLCPMCGNEMVNATKGGRDGIGCARCGVAFHFADTEPT